MFLGSIDLQEERERLVPYCPWTPELHRSMPSTSIMLSQNSLMLPIQLLSRTMHELSGDSHRMCDSCWSQAAVIGWT